MNGPIIKVENLSKRYRVGAEVRGYRTFREALVEAITAPIRNFRQLRSLGRHGNHIENEDHVIWAVKDVSFEVEPGEVLGIIGRNGAGKSTLLKVLSRIIEPTMGEAKIYGRVASLLEVGTGFHPELTGRENIYLNGTILGMQRVEIDRKFDQIVNFSEIGKFLDTPVKRYSSGMYVRLAFAVAAHLEPEILLVDEVLAVGDVGFQKKCLGKMGDVANSGRTVLFVSHNMAAVRGLCTRCLCLRDGQIMSKGQTEDVVSQYLVSENRYEQVSLKRRKNRRGSGLVRLTDIRFIDARSQETSEVALTGQALRIEIGYQAKEQSLGRIHRFNLGIAVFSSFGQLVTVLNSEQASKAFEELAAEGYVHCHIPKLALMPGTYVFNCTLHINGKLSDQVSEAAVLQVESGDFFDTGISRPHHRHGVYLEHRWYAESPFS
jgi:lipopolysaccharide transport system ATP-binding protein